MIAKAIDKIRDMTVQAMEQPPENIKLLNGQTFTFFKGAKLSNEPEMPDMLHLHSLNSLVAYIQNGMDSQWGAHKKAIIIESPTQVRLVGESRADYANRPVWVDIEPVLPEPFPFGRWMDGETFIIGLQSKFFHSEYHDGDDWSKVAEVVTGIRVDDGADYKDDGIAQVVTIQRGVSLKDRKHLPNPVRLSPYRTFPEVMQPASAFILRVSDGKADVPTLMLADADGGAWRLTAMQSIKSWLESALKDISSDIPVLG